MTLALRPYQEQGRDFLAARRFALLADEMRVGKTPQAILAAAKLNASSVTVVCPAIAVPQWKAEFRRWWMPHMPHVVSYDKAREIHKARQWERTDVAILDECHFAKNPQAARTKAVLGNGGLAWYAGRTWCLSGTPLTRHPGELWPMLRAFGVTALSYTDFTRRYCTFDWMGNVTGTRKTYLPELTAMIDSIMLRRLRRDVAPEMPDIDFEFLALQSDGLDFPIPIGLTDDQVMEWIERHRDNATRREIAVAKASGLADEIIGCFERGDYRQTVVFGWHRDALEALWGKLFEAGIHAVELNGETPAGHRVVYQRDFQAGDIQVLICQIAAAGTAIDLSAASHGYFLELDWVPANNMQAANRLVSLQKKEPVTFDICTWPGSADDRVQQTLLRRAKEIREIL